MKEEQKEWVQIGVRVPPNLRTQANIAAQLLGTPVVDIVTEALEAAIAKAGLKV